MSDEEEQLTEEKVFIVERAKRGTAACKKCKEKCPQGQLRLAKLTASPYGDGKMKNWYHVDCMFEQFLKQRATTKRIDSSDDIDGFNELSDDDKAVIQSKIGERGERVTPRKNPTPKPTSSESQNNIIDMTHRDNSFKQFRVIVAAISNESSFLKKSAVMQELVKKGSDGTGFKGDIFIWCRLMLVNEDMRVYNLKDKQLVKLFSRIFDVDRFDMLEHLEQGDIAETIKTFFKEPSRRSQLTIKEVDDYLEKLSKLTKEDEQISMLRLIAGQCTENDLKTFIQLIKHDLRMNAGAKHILEGVHPDAYSAYKNSRDLTAVLDRCFKGETNAKKDSINVMTPVLPMLAEACKSVEQAMKKWPNGMISEIKYDGERVQVHKRDNNFRYFSRSMKAVVAHKVAHLKDVIPLAFTEARELILDSEILMIDTQTGKPLPFGSLGVHKKQKFENASVCLFVFDCLYYNGQSLMDKPLSYRKKILEENMKEIPNRILLSEAKYVNSPQNLSEMIAKVLKLGLEGLVLKDVNGVYKPGCRHWLKVKKDYLFDGAMADTADLIVLGAWYGTGKKGGMMSVFLMGCYDPYDQVFRTVTKVHTGHDDKTLERLQSKLKMIKISMDETKVPPWLICTKTMIPDFVAECPKNQPVWEITGAEFTQHDVHTANGISIRFPRVTKIRDDKNWETATTLPELINLVKTSKENTDVSRLLNGADAESSASTSKIEKVKKRINSDTEKDKSPNKKQKTLTDVQMNMIENPLPDIFNSVHVRLDKKSFKRTAVNNDVLRHFIAFGGTVDWKGDSETFTHILYGKKMVLNEAHPLATHVSLYWIVQCINKEFLLEEEPYVLKRYS